MNIQVTIERLVLDGLSVLPAERPALRQSIETELARLLAEDGPVPSLSAGLAVRQLDGGTVLLAREQDSAGLGRQIARAVYGGMAR